MKLSKIIGDPEKFISKEETKKIKPISEFKSKYEILNRLSVGALSHVDLVKDKSSGEVFVAKTIKRSGAENPKQLWGFLQVLTKLDHPNLIHIYDTFADYQDLIFLLEYSKGGDLLDRIQGKPTFNESDVANIIQMALSGIIYLHEQKLSHSDLKPENVLFFEESSNTIKLSDYGLYQIMKPETLLSSSIGTPDFSPPELLVNKPPGMESDIWNIGVLAYFLLTGQLPFKGSLYQRYQSIITGQVEFGDEFEKYSTDAKDFIKKCLTLDLKERIKDSEALDHPWFANPGSNSIQRDSVISFLQKRMQTRENPEMKDSIAFKILRSGDQNTHNINQNYESGQYQLNNEQSEYYQEIYDSFDSEEDCWRYYFYCIHDYQNCCIFQTYLDEDYGCYC